VAKLGDGAARLLALCAASSKSQAERRKYCVITIDATGLGRQRREQWCISGYHGIWNSEESTASVSVFISIKTGSILTNSIRTNALNRGLFRTGKEHDGNMLMLECITAAHETDEGTEKRDPLTVASADARGQSRELRYPSQ